MSLKPASAHRWLARLLVVALHLALLAAWWQHRPARLDGSPARQFTTVRLIAPRPQPDTRPARPPAPPTPRPAAAPPPPVTPTPADAPPAPAGPAAAAALPPVTDTPPVEAPRTALRLLLPPGYAASAASAAAARNPALGDPRSNTTPRRTLEDRIADATGGSAGWVEESTSDNRSQEVGALGGRRTVMRRGDTCVELFRSRIADSDPFNGSVAPRAVSMAGKPYKCK